MSDNKQSKIKRALISVSDKTGILEFAKNLQSLGIEIISTGGTFKYFAQNGLEVIKVETITGFPEILDGRVKTLHPLIHGGILAERENDYHVKQMIKHNISGIDLVCINLYPFESTIDKPGVNFDEAIENIDIGGPAMVRAAAKNHKHVVILTSPKDYQEIIEELKNKGVISPKIRLYLAKSAFAHTAYYDSLICSYLEEQYSSEVEFREQLTIPVKLAQTLRYGENHHQKAAFYKNSGDIEGLLASCIQLQGKELSYNNFADADTAWECVKQFEDPTCVIVKHSNPCAVATSNDILLSYKKAFKSDHISSFGGIIAFNCEVNESTAQEITKQFVEVIIAPSYSHSVLEIFGKMPNIRLLQITLNRRVNKLDYKRIGGGLLIQTTENKKLMVGDLKVVTKKAPTDAEIADLLFAWNIVRFVKSNAIVLVKDRQSIGIGAGQTSRIDATTFALNKASKFGFDTLGSICASDAFFPFRDNIESLANAGVASIIQPGGSVKDQEVIMAADEFGIAMVFTSCRVFRH